ncbi:MAG: sulfotransferase family protein [Angustibacter sp.]
MTHSSATPARTSTSGRLPTFLHLGPGKSGSTWLHEVLSLHTDLYLTDAKDLYFFSRYFDRGPAWYRRQFAGAPDGVRVVGEVCPDYLAHPQAPDRIHAVLGRGVQLMATLRDPVDRAFSSYLYLAKHGLAAPTFRDTWRTVPELVEEGRYATQLRRYATVFGHQALYVSVFDDLQEDPQAFLDATTDRLGVDRLPLPDEHLEAKLPASKARMLPLAMAVQRGADWARRHDGAQVVGRIKRSALVQRALYRPLGDDRPVPHAADVDALRAELEPEVRGVEEDFALPLTRRWGWR